MYNRHRDYVPQSQAAHVYSCHEAGHTHNHSSEQVSLTARSSCAALPQQPSNKNAFALRLTLWELYRPKQDETRQLGCEATTFCFEIPYLQLVISCGEQQSGHGGQGVLV